MFNIERWKEIFQSIQKNKLRTVLSGLTVSLGILIFIILFGLGEGLKNSYADLFLNEANNVIYVYPGKTTKPFGGFKTSGNGREHGLSGLNECLETKAIIGN